MCYCNNAWQRSDKNFRLIASERRLIWVMKQNHKSAWNRPHTQQENEGHDRTNGEMLPKSHGMWQRMCHDADVILDRMAKNGKMSHAILRVLLANLGRKVEVCQNVIWLNTISAWTHIHEFQAFNCPTREWAKWVSKPVNEANERSERATGLLKTRLSVTRNRQAGWNTKKKIKKCASRVTLRKWWFWKWWFRKWWFRKLWF